MAVPVHAEYTVAGPGSPSATFTGNKPAGTVSGDLLVAFIASDLTQTVATGFATGGPTPPSGWTELHASSSARTGGGDVSGYVFWKIAGGSEPASYSWTFTSATGWGTVTIHRITGAHATTPIDSSSVANAVAGSTSITLGSVTTTAADCLLLAFVASDESANAGLIDSTYFANPMVTGWTQIDRAAWSGSTAYVVVGVASSSQASPGATGTKVASITSLNDGLIGYLVAVAPSAGGATNHAVAATGTLSTSAGTAAIAAEQVLAPSGTLTTAGTATIAATLPMAASGTLTTAGTADVRVLQYLAPSGTLTTSGTATITTSQVLAPSGTLTTAGTSTIAATLPLTASGTLATAGTADLVVVGPGGTSWPVAASGTLTTAGTAALRQTLAAPATGTLTTAGTATIAQTIKLTASGTLTTAGTAAFVSEVGTGVPPFYVRGVSVGGSGSSRGTPAAKRVGRVRVGG